MNMSEHQRREQGRITLRKIRSNMPAILDFLSSRGAEVLVPTNEWEVLRFKSGGSTGIVYRNAAGEITMQATAQRALTAYFTGTGWSAGVATKRTKNLPHVQALLQRDGCHCFLCGSLLGDDITRDHLVPVAHGGPNHISNLVLAHRKCNADAGHMTAMEKIALRELNLYGDRSQETRL